MTLATLATALVHVVWQASAAALGHALFGMRLRRAAARYAAGLSFLLAVPVAFALTLARASRVPATSVAVDGNRSDWAWGAVTSIATTPGDPSSWPSWGPRALVFAWCVGVVGLSLRHAGGLLWMQRWSTHASPVAASWRRVAQRSAHALGIARTVEVVQSAQTFVPMTFGFWRPVVVMPCALMAGLSPAEIELLLLHELVHVRRADYLVNLVQTAVECVFFFHPAVWWLNQRIREDRELACDAAVLDERRDSVGYAQALVAVASRQQPTLGGVAATGGDLKMRIQTILNPSTRRPRASWLMGALCAIGVSAGAIVACSSDVDDVKTAQTATTTTLGIAWLPDAVARHGSAITEAATREGVDPQLVALVVLVESNGDPKAVSPLGARGLMQLMPKTASDVAGRLGIAFSAEQLDDPSINLRLGTHLLRELLDARAGDDAIELALASYNAGSRAVDAHLAEDADLPEETTQYMALVTALYAERDDDASASYDAWQARRAGR